LAYQSYANICATFPNKSVAIITTEIILIPATANIFIGTAPELINYFVTSKKKFHIGIFDEIHVASNVYYDVSNKSDVIRAKSYARLISRCELQVIAASATIRNELVMCEFIKNQMNYYRTDNFVQLEDIQLIKYTTRTIPLIEYRFNNNDIIEPIIRDEIGNDSNTFETITEPDINSANLFKLLVKMRQRDMTPGIIFDITDDIAWKSYTELIDYIEKMEEIDYKCYYDMIETINKHINKFNTTRDIIFADIPENDNVDASRMRNGSMGNNKRDAGMRSILSERLKTQKRILDEAKKAIVTSIIKYNTEPWESLCVIVKESITQSLWNVISRICSTSKEELLSQYSNFKITKSIVDMFSIIKRIEESDSEQSDEMCEIILDKGSFYRFTESSCGMDQLKAIKEPGENQDSWKMRKRMITLAEAQNIHPKDIDGIIDIIMRGLEFGITIINASLPFVIQSIILDNLRTKNIGIVFASESMSMGINYALRFVIIKSPNNYISINPGKLIQMSGRCGRRGKDNQAHVIYWGISNAIEAHHNFIEPIELNHFLLDDNEVSGSIINDPESLAVQLGAIFTTLYFDEVKKKPVMPLSCTKNGGPSKIGTSKNGGYSRFNNFKKVDVPEVDEYEVREMSLLKKRTSDVKLLRSQYLDPIINILCQNIGYSELECQEITSMICKIDGDIIMDTFLINSFNKSRDVNLIMHMIIELHNSYASSVNIEFLNFLEKIVHILQGCEYRLIKLAR
jgi:hypothetical protein